MKFNKFLHNIIAASLLSVAFMACDTKGPVAGGSTDVETGGISGVAKFNLSNLSEEQLQEQSEVISTPEGTQIILTQLNDSNMSDSLAVTYADSLGRFDFDSIAPGFYSIESFHELSGKRNLNVNVEVSKDSVVEVEEIMHTPGKIIYRNIPQNLLDSNLIVYLPYLRSQYVLSVNADSLTIDSIPAGVNIEINYSVNGVDKGFLNEFTLPEDQSLYVEWP